MKTYGDTSLAPPAPDFHLLARREAAAEAMVAADLPAPEFMDIDSAFDLREPAGFAEVIDRETVEPPC